MNYRPSAPFAGCIVALLALGGAGVWAWHKVNSVPLALRANLTFLEALKFKNTIDTDPPTPAQLAAVRNAAVALKEKLTAEFPALKVTPRPVADDENGFLLLCNLTNHKDPATRHLPISDKFERILAEQSAAGEPKPWDPEAAEHCLAEHGELVSRIEHIAALTNRSSSNMSPEYSGIFNARAGKTSCDILLLKARLAAEAGDDTETLRLVAAAGNLGSHYHGVESPSLFSETVVILIDLEIRRIAFKSLLHALGRNADLDRWKAVLGNRSCTPSDLAAVMRGEWDIDADFMTFPVLIAAARSHQLQDPEAVARAYTSWINTCVTRLSSVELSDMATAISQPAATSNLSKEGREVISSLADGIAGWTKGYIRAAACLAQFRAGLDLLVLEKSGVTLADAGQVTRDPVSGSAFLFDADKRTVAAPPGTAALNVEPLALPW